MFYGQFYGHCEEVRVVVLPGPGTLALLLVQPRQCVETNGLASVLLCHVDRGDEVMQPGRMAQAEKSMEGRGFIAGPRQPGSAILRAVPLPANAVKAE